jgi:outer membrane protein with beta-barrel domain
MDYLATYDLAVQVRAFRLGGAWPIHVTIQRERKPGSMSYSRSALGALVLTLGAASVAFAQDHAVRVFARGGGYNALTNLNDAGTSDFKKVGYNVGGGIGVQANRYLTVRGDFSFGRNELRSNQVATGIRTNRFFYDAAVQLQYPTASGLEPYLFAGGGAVTLHQVGTSGQNKTRAAGTFGLGLNYQVPKSPFGIFAEGKSWLYKLENMSGALAGFDKTQFDVAWSGGISYRFPW